MLKSVTLRNFKSFGEEQTVPLQPITVLVGPNNSGKSSFISVASFLRACLTASDSNVVARGAEVDFLFHRPVTGDSRMYLRWDLGDISHAFEVARQASSAYLTPETWTALRSIRVQASSPYQQIASPWLNSRVVKLALPALQEDARVVESPRLDASGAGLAAVLGLWRNFDMERAARLDAFVHACLPEIKHVLARPGEGTQRLWVEQTDGEKFDSLHLSDGVLYFIGLAMQVIEAEPGSLLFIEEPEQSIHPRRLAQVVDHLRKAVEQFDCQFVIATHSPVLLNAFRDEPEAIVLFRRGEHGTRTRTLAEVPELVAALRKADPGDLLANGFFNDAF